MDASTRTAAWIVAIAAIVAGMHWFADILTQFALALILWLVIDGLARYLAGPMPQRLKVLALPIAIVFVLSLATLVVIVVARNIGDFTTSAGAYERRLEDVAAQVYSALGLPGPPPTFGELLARANPTDLFRSIAESLQGLASDTVFILIYLGFLLAAGTAFPRKLDAIFVDTEARARARYVLTSIRLSMERYLWVQTLASIIITALTYMTLELIGLDNALFWAFLIFFLNYIPTIGSIIAVVLPTLFALVESSNLAFVGGVAAGVGVWQFVIGNFVQPRLTGDSLNLSAVVVLLALAIWGTIWGIAGAFLAAPLTVGLMIVLAQFPDTRWIAVLLSANDAPEVYKPSGASSPLGG